MAPVMLPLCSRAVCNPLSLGSLLRLCLRHLQHSKSTPRDWGNNYSNFSLENGSARFRSTLKQKPLDNVVKSLSN